MTNVALRAFIGWIDIISGDDAIAKLQLRVGDIFSSIVFRVQTSSIYELSEGGRKINFTNA
jgi:hypothetical protein